MSILWSKDQEKDFFIKSLELAQPEQLFYLTKDKKFYAYWPRNYKGAKTTLQSRNSLIGSCTEKGSSASPSTAWGTWLAVNNPVLRDVHEYILIFCKDTFTRYNPYRRKSTISKDEFLEFTKSIWSFSAERASKVGHPAPFSVDLPYYLIQFYTFEGEVILDPLAGSETTCIAALKTNRKYIGYDIDKNYCDFAEQRIKQFSQKLGN